MKVIVDRIVLDQALDALNSFLSDDLRPYQAAKVYDTLRTALAQAQEPVAWMHPRKPEQIRLSPQDGWLPLVIDPTQRT